MKVYGPEMKKNEDSLLDQNMTVFRDKSRRSVKLEGIFRVKVFAIKARVSIYLILDCSILRFF